MRILDKLFGNQIKEVTSTRLEAWAKDEIVRAFHKNEKDEVIKAFLRGKDETLESNKKLRTKKVQSPKLGYTEIIRPWRTIRFYD
jgi:hypothetical protein